MILYEDTDHLRSILVTFAITITALKASKPSLCIWVHVIHFKHKFFALSPKHKVDRLILGVNRSWDPGDAGLAVSTLPLHKTVRSFHHQLHLAFAELVRPSGSACELPLLDLSLLTFILRPAQVRVAGPSPPYANELSLLVRLILLVEGLLVMVLADIDRSARPVPHLSRLICSLARDERLLWTCVIDVLIEEARFILSHGEVSSVKRAY